MRLNLVFPGIATAVALAACGPTITLTDDIDVTWDFGPTLSSFDSGLNTPYVRGTKVELRVHSSDDDAELHGWTVESADPSVFRIDGDATTIVNNEIEVSGVAVGEGTVDLAVYDDRHHVVGHAPAEVLEPDRIELDAHGYLIIGEDDQAPVDEVRMLAGGTATYLVRYFRDGRELHGNGVLTVDAPAGITAEPRTTFLFESREWLTLTATATTSAAIHLYADHDKAATFALEVVPQAAIEDVVLLSQRERGHHDGDWLVTLGQAWDADGRRIFGIDYDWDVDGVPQTGDGDLYRYKFKKGQFQMVSAQAAGHSDSMMIQSDDGFVDSSNNVGCAATGGASWAMVGLVGAGAIVRRRQARR